MEADKIIIGLLSLSGIAFTYWFFLMKNEDAVSVTSHEIDITVNGGYRPDVISIPKGKTTKINFLRTDTSSCLEEVILSDFRIKKYLPINKTVSVEITPQENGEYRFSCGMNMFHGKIIVKDPEQS